MRPGTNAVHGGRFTGYRISSLTVGVNALLVITSLAMVFPFVWMILGAFKPQGELSRPIPSFLPEQPSLENFVYLFSILPFQQFFLNSVLVTVTSVVAILFTSSLVGYVFARHRFWGSQALFLLLLSSIVVPFEVKVVPMFLVIKDLGWIDTYQALIVPFVVDAFGIYLFREFIRGIPDDYFDAAKLDGASEWQMYRRIALPLTTPVMSALAIFSFVYLWDQLIWPVVAISSEAMKTLPLGMALLSTERGARFDLALAAGVIAVIPPLVIFLVFQRRIVRGVTLAGLKG